jgi:hypothetical protein
MDQAIKPQPELYIGGEWRRGRGAEIPRMTPTMAQNMTATGFKTAPPLYSHNSSPGGRNAASTPFGKARVVHRSWRKNGSLGGPTGLALRGRHHGKAMPASCIIRTCCALAHRGRHAGL